MSELRVPLGACQCPGTPHPDGDWVEMYPRLDMKRAMAVLSRAAGDDEELIAFALVQGYARFGIEDWNLANGEGKKLELNAVNLQRFSEEDPRSLAVGSRGDDLYSQATIVPLATAANSLSPTTQTNGATSAPNGHRPKSRKRSKPSLTTTTPTGVIVKTGGSPAGVSSS